jgi:hypothetical protein
MEKGNELRPPPGNRIYREQLITIEDLNAFKEELLTAIKHMLTSSPQQAAKKWLKSFEVRKLLTISPGTLQNLRVNGILPYTKIGGLFYYDSEEIYKMLSRQKEDIPSITTPPRKRRPSS